MRAATQVARQLAEAGHRVLVTARDVESAAAVADSLLVNVASGAGSHGDEQFGLTRRGGQSASYGISKGALLALTSTLDAELDGSKVLARSYR